MSELSDAQKEILIQLYNSAKRTRDDLPYTEEFEQMYIQFVIQTGVALTRHQVWRALASAGKAKHLDRKKR